jgi:hypothetical protein
MSFSEGPILAMSISFLTIRRIDEMLYFLPFSNAELMQLATIEMDKWASRAQKRHNIKLEWSQEALQAIVKEYDIHYGARSIQHAVDSRIINKIAAEQEAVCRWVIPVMIHARQGKILHGSHVRIEYRDSDFALVVQLPLSTEKKSTWW